MNASEVNLFGLNGQSACADGATASATVRALSGPSVVVAVDLADCRRRPPEPSPNRMSVMVILVFERV
jgi:hypothetical protein